MPLETHAFRDSCLWGLMPLGTHAFGDSCLWGLMPSETHALNKGTNLVSMLGVSNTISYQCYQPY
jgi:hypothetical protein